MVTRLPLTNEAVAAHARFQHVSKLRIAHTGAPRQENLRKRGLQRFRRVCLQVRMDSSINPRHARGHAVAGHAQNPRIPAHEQQEPFARRPVSQDAVAVMAHSVSEIEYFRRTRRQVAAKHILDIHLQPSHLENEVPIPMGHDRPGHTDIFACGRYQRD